MRAVCGELIVFFSLIAVGAGYWLFGNSDRREKVVEKVDYRNYYEFCSSHQIIYDIDSLKADLQDRLFGQHIVNATLIPALRAHVRNLHRSEKPLVMSFHGLIGTGKNYVADLIVKHFYRNGDHSRFVHKYLARKDFPLAEKVDQYRVSITFGSIRFGASFRWRFETICFFFSVDPIGEGNYRGDNNVQTVIVCIR